MDQSNDRILGGTPQVKTWASNFL